MRPPPYHATATRIVSSQAKADYLNRTAVFSDWLTQVPDWSRQVVLRKSRYNYTTAGGSWEDEYLGSSGTGGTGGNYITTGNTTTAASTNIRIFGNATATASFVWPPTSARYLNFTYTRTRSRAKLTPRPVNHRGEPLRSENKADQWSNASPEELTALQLLRKMVDPDEFRRYLKHGFIQVRAPSGLVYQIGRGASVKVWDQGVLLATLCVHLKERCPPTDEVIGKLLIAEYDEKDLWARSNKSWRTADRDRPRLKLLGIAA